MGRPAVLPAPSAEGKRRGLVFGSARVIPGSGAHPLSGPL